MVSDLENAIALLTIPRVYQNEADRRAAAELVEMGSMPTLLAPLSNDAVAMLLRIAYALIERSNSIN